MPDGPSNLDLVRRSIRATNLAVVKGEAPGPPEDPSGSKTAPPGMATPYQQAEAKAVQSIAQTTAIVIQDAADSLRNINIIEVTAIGAATAAWIATKVNDPWEAIIDKSMEVMAKAAENYLTIGKNAYAVLNQFED